MSTALSAIPEAGPTGPLEPARVGDAFPELGDPAGRGSLTVGDRVVERVAGYAVTLVDGASAAPRRVLGRSVGGASDDREASVDARVDGNTATIHTSIAIGWPASIREVASRVRAQVRDDVERIAGVRVAHVDIDVVSMSAPAARRKRVQ